MRNVTITLDEKVARWARIWAAQHDSSVSRLVGELLTERMQREEGYDVAMRRYMAQTPVNLSDSKPYPRRADLYD